jgi:Ca2+-binding EF-hand superfamily protein
LEIAKQIKAALISNRIAYKEAFNRFDVNQDGFLSFSEFSNGIDTIMTLSIPVKEKFFGFMDKNEIGLVDYKNFLDIIQSSAAKDLKKNNITDSFDWENSIIE